MSKYIDAEKLKALLEQRKKQLAQWTDKEYANQRIDEIDCILDVDIDSLQQEPQEVDLEKEIEKYYYDNFAFISSAHTPTKDIVSDIATHFYERGQKNAANKFDEIEYNRQRAQEQEGQR